VFDCSHGFIRASIHQLLTTWWMSAANGNGDKAPIRSNCRGHREQVTMTSSRVPWRHRRVEQGRFLVRRPHASTPSTAAASICILTFDELDPLSRASAPARLAEDCSTVRILLKDTPIDKLKQAARFVEGVRDALLQGMPTGR
jgi:hypothetical protein